MSPNPKDGSSSGEPGPTPPPGAPGGAGGDGWGPFARKHGELGPAPGATAAPGVEQAGRPLPPVVGKILGRLFRLPCDLLVAATGDDLWDLDQDEVEILRDATVEVCNAHNVTLDPKRQAWGVMALAIVAIYGGRVTQYRAKKALEAKPVAPSAS